MEGHKGFCFTLLTVSKQETLENSVAASFSLDFKQKVWHLVMLIMVRLHLAIGLQHLVALVGTVCPVLKRLLLAVSARALRASMDLSECPRLEYDRVDNRMTCRKRGSSPLRLETPKRNHWHKSTIQYGKYTSHTYIGPFFHTLQGRPRLKPSKWIQFFWGLNKVNMLLRFDYTFIEKACQRTNR